MIIRERRRLDVQRGTRADHAGPDAAGPRCRKLLAAYEIRGVPALPGEYAACGRPEGHGGQCYSEAAWRRKLEANARGVQAARRREAAAREKRDAA